MLHFKKATVGIILVLITAIVGCETTNSKSISVIDAVKNYQNYDGRTITVKGVLILEFEDYNLYASRKDAREKIAIDTNCLSLSISKDQYLNWKSKSGTYVSVTGILNSEFCKEDQFCPSSCNEVGLEKIQISS